MVHESGAQPGFEFQIPIRVETVNGPDEANCAGEYQVVEFNLRATAI
jgi:hypothetical protein